MKLKKLFGNWSNAIKAFPISYLLLLIISIFLIGKIEGILDISRVNKLLMAFSISFITSCYGPLVDIHSNIKNKQTINRTLQICSLILGGIYYLIISKVENLFDLNYSESLLYFGIFPICLLLIPLVIALLHSDNQSKIRYSRRSLFISICSGVIAGSIIRGGIAGALSSIEALFDVNINGDWYAYIGVISEVLISGSFIFNYYLILAENINSKSEFKIEKSRLRKIFGSYIFLPLAIIYLLIFGAYGIKILVTGVWPRGIIVRLGIGYFILGIISLYLVFPDKTKLQEVINKILHVSFILIAFMMIGAISQRINQYGITINRRLICYIIAAIIIYSALSLILPNKRFLSFVSTLAFLAILAIYSPISASNIGFKSQLNRLQTLLSKENLTLPLNEGDLKDTDNESTKLIIGTLDELVENYNKDKIINKIINYEYENSYRSSRYDIRDFLGASTDYTDYYPTYKFRDFRQYGRYQKSIDVTGYSKVLYFTKAYGGPNDFTLTIPVDDQEYKVDLSNYIPELKEKSEIYAKFELTDEQEELLRNPALVLTEENYKLIINSFGMQENKDGESQITNSEGYILIK